VGLVTFAALLAVLIGLVRHGMLLARTLARFRDEVGPLAEEVAAESSRAAERGAQGRIGWGERP
jgi:hypothetical protein